jgi:hypothetical protein
MRKYKKASVYFVSALGLLAFITLTSPNKVPAILLILPFIAVFFLVLGVLKLFERKVLNLSAKRQAQTRKLLFPYIGAGMLTILLILSSLGQLAVRDVVLVILLGLLAAFYISRAYRPGTSGN